MNALFFAQNRPKYAGFYLLREKNTIFAPEIFRKSF